MADINGATGGKSRLDGDDLRDMFAAATQLFEGNIDAVNALNVFPVPDGDTGTNMFLTLRAVNEAAADVQSSSASQVAGAMAKGALMGARGNSGVILSQFFKGIAVGLGEKSDFDAADLARAFEQAKEYSYKAVGDPVEGTVLTVISRVADASRERAGRGGTIEEVLEATCEAATAAVAETPAMLSVLREAGVVDAGGHGLSIVLEGARRFVMGEGLGASEMRPPEPLGADSFVGGISESFLRAVEDDRYGYCTQIMVDGVDLEPETIRDQVAALGSSAVVVGDETTVKLHAHMEDPGPLVSLAVSYGTLSQVKIENIDEQHQAFSASTRSETQVVPVAVVAVASGDGLEALYANLGASRVLRGGDTMNPSVQEMLEAVDEAQSENVIFLPNNPNILPAARQAAELSGKHVEVVPSVTIPQGIAATLAFSPEKDPEANVSDMEDALGSVRTGEVTRAVRSAKLHGRSVKRGQVIGMLERKLVAAGDEVTPVLLSLLQKAGVSDGDLVTLYWGDMLTKDDADEAMVQVTATFSDVEVEVVPGGQPHYQFIVSIE